jgi:hypothetical protein
MKYEFVALIWNDAFAFEEEELTDENFQLSPTLQCGIVVKEDNEKIRLVHGFSLDHDEHDFIVIPKASILKRKTLGIFDSETNEIWSSSEK